MAFPVSSYAKYKQATEFFLDWLLLARSRGKRVAGASASARFKLDAFQEVVDQIAREPSAFLTPRVLSQLPRALDACQSAITLRERVSTFFATVPGSASNAEMQSHQHFLSRLKAWYAQLKSVEDQTALEADAGTRGNMRRSSSRFSNYYEVLSVEADYFDDEEMMGDFIAAASAPVEDQKRIAVSRKVDRAAIFNEAFAQDQLFEVVSYFLELEDLVEAVYNEYYQVKLQKKTLIEATAVVKVAMECATSLTVKLQLRYPAIQLAQDLLSVLSDKMPSGYTRKMATTVIEFWERCQKSGYKFQPGILVMELQWVASSLATFTSAIPENQRTALILKDGFFGESYSEERHPHYVLPDPSKHSSLLLQQLPLIYNSVISMKARGQKIHSSSLTGEFLSMMDEYFTTKKVTMPLVFATVCWIKSVGCLQGDGGLGRNISLTITHSWDLLDRLERTLKKGYVHAADQEIHQMLGSLREEIDQSKKGWLLIRANPLMAGFMMLDYHFKYLHLASETLLVTSRFRAFGHLYSALLDRKLLTSIPFFDRILDQYEPAIFTPSRAAAVHGSFTRTYFVSSHMTDAAVDAMFWNEPQPRSAIDERKCLRLRDLSHIFRLLFDKDTAVLGHEVKASSSKALLAEVSRICSMELFDTRVLSRDMLRLNDDLTDLFSQLCDELDRRQYHDEYLAGHEPNMTRQYMINRALEDAVMTPLMPFLDCLNTDGRIDLSNLPTQTFNGFPAQLLDTSPFPALCQKAADVITRKFSLSSRVFHERYFLFSPEPDFVKREFGVANFKKVTKNGNRAQVFSDLMDVMEESEGPLAASKMSELKSKIKQDPEVMAILSMGSIESTTGPIVLDPALLVKSELCTLLHHAAAGPAHDTRLVEWMIQMGTLFNQPTAACRAEPDPRARRIPRSQTPDQMAVHSAAVVGHIDIVRLMLEADNLRDLNTRTYHTRETLAHLAVRYGHRDLYALLAGLGADLRIKNGDGKSIFDMTSDVDWKQKIIEATLTIEQSEERSGSAKNREALFHHLSQVRAEKVRKSLNKQRDQERASAGIPRSASAKPPAPGSASAIPQDPATSASPASTSNAEEPPVAAGLSSSKKKKKGKKSPRQESAGASAEPSTEVDATSNLLKYLLFGAKNAGETVESNGNERTQGFIGQLPENIARLNDTSITEAEAAPIVKDSCTIVHELRSFVAMFAMKDRVNATARGLRIQVVSDATRAIHLMQKFHRFDHKPQLARTLAPLKCLCEMNAHFGRIVIETSLILASLSRKLQVQELLDLLEERLVALKAPRPEWFRGMVQRYTETRLEMRLGKTSSPESLRELEWYCDNHIEDDYDLQLKLDTLVGFPIYSTVRSAESPGKFEKLVRAVERAPQCKGVICYADTLFFG